MTEEEKRAFIFQALGEASALFMSQGETKAKDVVMPTEELTKIGEKLAKQLGV